MSIRSGQSKSGAFPVRNITGAASNADSLPTATLYLNGVANAASVTIANQTTGVYKWTATMPTLAIGDQVEIIVSATVGGIAGIGSVWSDTYDIALDASGRIQFQVGTGTGQLNTLLGNVTVSSTSVSAISTGVWNVDSGGLFNEFAFGNIVLNNPQNTVNALKADLEWKTVLAGVNGVFRYNKTTKVLSLYDKTETTLLATLQLTLDGTGTIVTDRTSS